MWLSITDAQSGCPAPWIDRADERKVGVWERKRRWRKGGSLGEKEKVEERWESGREREGGGKVGVWER